MNRILSGTPPVVKNIIIINVVTGRDPGQKGVKVKTGFSLCLGLFNPLSSFNDFIEERKTFAAGFVIRAFHNKPA